MPPKMYEDPDHDGLDAVLVNGVDRLAAHRAAIRDANRLRRQREATRDDDEEGGTDRATLDPAPVSA